jgi:hypothetical protein
MLRFLFRLLAIMSLALAVILAVMDATRSIALSKFDPTPLGALWLEHAPSSLTGLQGLLTGSAAFLWDPALLTLLRVPSFVFFAALALLLYAVGHRPEPRARTIAIGR